MRHLIPSQVRNFAHLAHEMKGASMNTLYGILAQLSPDDLADILRVARGLASLEWCDRWLIYTELLCSGIMSIPEYLDTLGAHSAG